MRALRNGIISSSRTVGHHHRRRWLAAANNIATQASRNANVEFDDSAYQSWLEFANTSPMENFQNGGFMETNPSFIREVKRGIFDQTPPEVDRNKWAEFTADEFIGWKGGEIIHEMLRRNGVETLFGYPGGAILPFFDALHGSPMDFVLVRHEANAGHMAEGYARIQNKLKPGVAVVTSGPGSTNMVTPLQDALMDGSPIVCITGQVAQAVIGTDAFQETPIIDITKPCTKWNHQIRDLSDICLKINEAFHISTHGRPGPVLLDIPKDIGANVLTKPMKTNNMSSVKTFHCNAHKVLSDEKYQTLNRMVEMINKAKKPVIYSGQGTLQSEGAVALVRELSEKADIPVTTTLLGMGAMDEENERSLHMLGMHGSAYANYSMQAADLIICLGARFDDRCTGAPPTFAPEAVRAENEGRGGIIQIDVDARQINKVIMVTEACRADLGTALREIMPKVERKKLPDWSATIQNWKQTYNWGTTFYPSAPGEFMKIQEIVQELDRQTADIKDKTYITTGVGQHQMWTAQHFRWRHPNRIITSGGHGTMGFGIPSAIGAKMALDAKGETDSTVVCIDGDGSVQMSAMELQTAAEFGVNVKIIITNNDGQGMIVMWQNLFYEGRLTACKQKNPDFVKLAEAMGCKGLRAATKEELPEKMAEFLAYKDGPIVLDAICDREEHVYPMVQVGKSLNDLLLSPECYQKAIPEDKTQVPS